MTTEPLNCPPSPLPKSKLWLAALQPPMYSVAVMPIALGTAVAYFQTGQLQGKIFVTFVASAVLILAWENFSNDVFDSETGIDRNNQESLVNLTGNKRLIFWIANGFLGLGIAGILAIALWQQDATVLGLIALCCGLGYLYQGPPFRLGYQGLGEILCFFAFGPVGVAAAYYSQTQSWSLATLIASIILGITTSLILFCSHFHQVEDDQAAGKRSPIVRLGTRRAAQLLPWLCGIVFGLSLVFVLSGTLPIWALLMWASLPFALKLCRHGLTNHDKPDRIMNLKFLAVGLHFWSSILLCIGFWLG